MQAEPFLDNWTYLKVELNWLERLLLTAVARQRKETREIDRVAKTAADRATSHWWKGLVSLEGPIAYDSPVERRKSNTSEAKGNYHQQLEAKIRATQQKGIELALPALCDRLSLSPFEKNLILMGLAPEVHRRYAQLYGYLQGKSEHSDLPNVDLALRLFCRTDIEWRTARSSLTASSPLIQNQLIELLSPTTPLLNRSIKISDRLVDLLLSESVHTPQLHYSEFGSFSTLVLPESLLADLQHLCHQMQFGAQVDEEWGFQRLIAAQLPGIVALMVGAAGTGKLSAASAIAQALNTPVMQVDFAGLSSLEQAELMRTIVKQAPTVLLIRSAEIGLGRTSPVAHFDQFLETRRSSRSLTLLSVRRLPVTGQRMRSQIQQTLHFPLPDRAARLKLWQQAFPSQVLLASDIDWDELTKRALTGGEIGAIVRSAAFFAAAESSVTLEMNHLRQALKKAKPSVLG
ncbi:MAG: ATP-binding protein [Phormidesmis sp. CAN_BIN36]|nr:ATP-binding protein [Phormidesmis sp. CAN_BIN36]